MPIYEHKTKGLAYIPGTTPKPVPVPLNAEQLTGVFKKHDRNGDGRLDWAELKEAFKYLGALIPGWRADRGLKNADANGDGFITEDELNCLVNYAINLGYTLN